jgi:hypothetical protein
MTKLVEFTRDMKPWRRGDRYALPDAVADEAVLSEAAIVVPSVFDKAAPEPALDQAAERERRDRLQYRTRGGRFAKRS